MTYVLQGSWGLGVLENDQDVNALSDIVDSLVKLPLKGHVIRLRLKVWEQKQLKKKSEYSKSPSPETESTYVRRPYS